MKHTVLFSKYLSVALLAAGAFGCGDSSGGGGGAAIPTDYGPASNGKFTYEEGAGGTTPGLWARATVAGQEVRSNEVEVVLRAESNVVQQELSASQEALEKTFTPDAELNFGGETRSIMPLEALATQNPGEFGRQVAARFQTSRQKLDQALAREARRGSATPEGIGDELAPPHTTVRQALQDPCPGKFPKTTESLATKEIGTFDGWSAVLDWTGYSTQADYTWAKHLAPEGVYYTLQKGYSVSVPADPISAGWNVNYTMVKAPPGGAMSVQFLDDTTSIGFSADTGIGGLTMSFSYDIVVHPAHGAVGVGIGFGVGLSAGFFGLISLPIAFNLSSAGIVSGGEPGYFIYTGAQEPCSVEPGVSRDNPLTVSQALNSNPMEQLNQTTAQQASAAPTSRRNALANGASAMMNPLFSALSDTTGHGPAKHVAAATNADLYADYLTRGDDCAHDCPDTSFSYINARGVSQARAADSDAEKLQVGYSGIMKVMESVPQINMQWALQKPTTAAVSLVEEGVIGGQQGDENAYVSEAVERIEVIPGESADFVITAEEIAELLGAQPADVEGAHVCLELLMDLDASPACTELTGGAVTGSFVLNGKEAKALRVTVELDNAAGFSGQDVSEWIVKPAIRIFVPKASSSGATSILLTGARSIVSGGPMSLSAMLVDAHGVPIDAAVDIEFLNYKGEAIGSAPTKHGVATFQYVPTPVDAEISSFEPKTLESTDGETTYEGYGMTGVALSRYAKVYIDDKPVTDNDGHEVPNGHLNWAIRPIDHTSIAFVPYDDASRLATGSHTIELVGPTGESTSFTFELN